MQRVNIFLTEKQIAALKFRSKREGLAYAELVRRAIDEYLARKKPDA